MANLQQQLVSLQGQLAAAQGQVNAVQADTTITASCSGAVTQAQNSLNTANQAKTDAASVASGGESVVASNQPTDNASDLPWPQHSWPLTQSPADLSLKIDLVNAQLAANQQMLSAYAQC